MGVYKAVEMQVKSAEGKQRNTVTPSPSDPLLTVGIFHFSPLLNSFDKTGRID
jgi:hypothetical protein